MLLTFKLNLVSIFNILHFLKCDESVIITLQKTAAYRISNHLRKEGQEIGTSTYLSTFFLIKIESVHIYYYYLQLYKVKYSEVLFQIYFHQYLL